MREEKEGMEGERREGRRGKEERKERKEGKKALTFGTKYSTGPPPPPLPQKLWEVRSTWYRRPSWDVVCSGLLPL